MILKLAFKNIISRKSSVVIILFMSFAVALLSVTNAIFDSTEQGVQSCYVNSFTGDFVVRPKTKQPLSLFGDETPVTGELTKINFVVPYNEITSLLENQKNISTFVPQISGMSLIEKSGSRTPVYMFGVNGESYVKIMPSLKIVNGVPYKGGEKSVMLSTVVAKKLGASVGDNVQFTVSDGPNFRIRSAEVSAIYEYEIHNQIFERFVLVNPETVKSILDISDTLSLDQLDIEENKTDLLEEDLNLDDLFESADDVGAVIEESQEEISETENIENDSIFDSTSWNFIICRMQNGKDTNKMISKLNRTFRKNDWPVEAVNWRNAAGSTALYLYWIRIIFNAGIIVVLAAGLIIVNNTLVINVMDRTREIGTLQALGAGSVFVSLECMAENFTLAITSGIVGTVVAFIVSAILNRVKITFANTFLIQLFGGNTLVTHITLNNIASIFMLVLVLGIVGWIYPVSTALKISPVQAMQGDK